MNLLNPAADTYTVYVHGYDVPVPVANFTLFTWALPASAAGNMTVAAPGPASIGTNGTILVDGCARPRRVDDRVIRGPQQLPSQACAGGSSR